MTDFTADSVEAIESLTEKQRGVLELLIEHKTSKEIARVLEISPHTVDQRINFSKQKLGASSRGELATKYRALKDVYEQSVYRNTDIDPPRFLMDQDPADDTSMYLLIKNSDMTEQSLTDSKEADHRVVPEMFEGSRGTLIRVLAILLGALLLVSLGLSGLAIFSQLSEMLAV